MERFEGTVHQVDGEGDSTAGNPESQEETQQSPPEGVEILPPPFAPRDDISGITALVIDVDKFQRTLIKNALSAQRIHVFVEAATTADALVAAKKAGKIDLIIMENVLQGETGIEFVRRIRHGETKLDPAVPIVMVSHVSNQDMVAEARDAGVHEFIVKPFNIGGLVERVMRPFRYPRKFIRAPGYVGPDRRWLKDEEQSCKRRTGDNIAFVDPAAAKKLPQDILGEMTGETPGETPVETAQ